MTFDAYEESIEAGRPIELYKFTMGTEVFYYTSAEDTISFGGNSYVSRQIKRNSPDQSSEEGRGKLEVTLPTDDPVCSRFIGVVPPLPMTIVLTQFHRADLLDGRVLWTGRVLSSVFTEGGSLCQLTIVASESALSRAIPTFKYQSLCNHFLYSPACGVDPDSFKFEGIASNVSGNTLEVMGLYAAHGEPWSIGGKIVFGNDVRTINAVDYKTLTLTSMFESDPTGQLVTVYAGCDHTRAVCKSKFSNFTNFGGFPAIPTKNPFNSGIGA